MEQFSTVRDVSVRHDGQTHNASYFVENEVIRIRLGDRTIACPLGAMAADSTAKALLVAHLLETTRKANVARS